MYTDHYSFLLTFRGLPQKKKKIIGRKKVTIWNTKNPRNWEKYFQKTSDNRDLDEIVSSVNSCANEVEKKLEKVVTSLKFKCFGKVSIKTSTKAEDEVVKLQREKC